MWDTSRKVVLQIQVDVDDKRADGVKIIVQVRINVEDIKKELDEFGSQAYKFGKANKENRVVGAVKEELEGFKKILPVVEQLANPALRDRHFHAIFAILGLDKVCSSALAHTCIWHGARV